MIKYSPALTTALNAATNKRAWCAKLIEMLGSSLTFTCKRDPGSKAADPWSTGTTFYKASLVGAASVRGDSVVNFGLSKNVTTKLAADLGTGKSVLRIEGNGNWIEFSLGLITSSCDIRAKRSPTAKTGLSLNNISVAAKPSLPFGVGPSAPADTVNTTVTAVIEDMRIPAFPKVVGNLNLDLPRENLIFEDLEMATQFGDIRITQTKNTVIFGQFEFGVTRFDMNKILNAEADVPLEQGLIYCKPYGVWPTYPLMDTWIAERDLTYPQAFRVRLVRGDGTTWKTLQMRDGLPINSPELGQSWEREKPLRPHWSCGMMLPWQSHLPKHSDLMAKYFNGMEASSIRPSQAKEGDSANASIPLAARSAQVNGQLQYFAAPQWPQRFDPVWGGSADVNAGDTFDDPWLYDVRTWHSDEGRRANITGWDYEPGSLSGHDHLAYKGGVRHDRAIVNTPLVMFASDYNSRRLKGNVPWRNVLNAYALAMFNTPHHWVTDIKTCHTLPKELVMSGKVGTYGNRYGGRLQDVTGGMSRVVWAHGVADGGPWPDPPERGGHQIWGGFQQDHLHNSLAPGLMVIMLNSIMHLVCQTMRFTGGVMCQTGAGLPPSVSAREYFLEREGAFRWLQYTVQWKLGTKHSIAQYQKEDMEVMFQNDLESVYDNILVPTKLQNSQDEYFIGLRNFGIGAAFASSSWPVFEADGKTIKLDAGGNKVYEPVYSWTATHDSKVFYYAQLMVLMRQFGLWKVLKQRSAKCAAALDFLVECLDKYSIEAFYHSKGRSFLYDLNLSPWTRSSTLAPGQGIQPMATGWLDWSTRVYPAEGLESMFTAVDGSSVASPMGNQAATVHLMSQYILMRPIYFPEYAHPLLADATVMLKAQYKKFDDFIATFAANPRTQAGYDWKYRWPTHGILKAPSILEPI